MAEVKVNLLKKKRGITESQYVAERRVFISSVVVLLISTVVAGVFFALQIISTNRLKKVEAEITEVENQLLGLREASIRQLYLKNRLEIVSNFFDSRIEDREALQQIFSLDIPGVVITGASFESEETVSLRLTSENVLALDAAYLYFEEEDTYFVQAVNRGVSRGDEATYNMNVELTLPQGDES